MVTEIKNPVLLRPMVETDLPAASELSVEQAWPHNEEDWRLFFDLGEGIVAERDGVIVGSAMAWRLGERFATIGMVIVRPGEQGQGIGRRLMEAILARLEGYSVLLNATAEGVPLYRRLGFVEIGTVQQHQGPAPAMPLAELIPGERVRPMGATDSFLPDLYSRAAGMDRRAQFDTLAANGSTVVLSRDHEPVGFAMLRRFGRGRSIAPLVAPDLGGAKVLLTHWLGAHAGTFCRADAIGGTGLSEWLEEIGLPCVGTVRTMVRGPAPEVDPAARIFTIAAQALG